MVISILLNPLDFNICKASPDRTTWGLPNVSLRISISLNLKFRKPVPRDFATASLAANFLPNVCDSFFYT